MAQARQRRDDDPPHLSVHAVIHPHFACGHNRQLHGSLVCGVQRIEHLIQLTHSHCGAEFNHGGMAVGPVEGAHEIQWGDAVHLVARHTVECDDDLTEQLLGIQRGTMQRNDGIAV